MREDIRRMYVATRSFTCVIDGVVCAVEAGRTRVTEDSSLLRFHRDSFERDGDSRVEAAVENPGEARTAAEVVW
jgi:hypothetical protein